MCAAPAGGWFSTGMISVGLGIGKTYESEECNRRMRARSLMAMGPEYKPAALLTLTGMSVEAALLATGLMPTVPPGVKASVDGLAVTTASLSTVSVMDQSGGGSVSSAPRRDESKVVCGVNTLKTRAGNGEWFCR